MKIVGEKIYLLSIGEKDTKLIVNWRNNPEVRSNFIHQEPFTDEIHNNWMEEMVATGKVVQFIIYNNNLCLNDTKSKPIGSVFIRDINKIHNKAEYGIFIGEDSARGKGYGSEATKMMISYAFEELKLHKLALRVFAHNERGIRCYENAGFVKEAYLKDEVRINSLYYDIILMGILNPIENGGRA